MPPSRSQFYSRRLKYFRIVWLAVSLAALTSLSRGGQAGNANADFLIESWQDHDGLPESSALAVAQTPDGYIWVGSNEGLLRFNGISFLRAEKFSDFTRLAGTVSFLETDRSGRLWAGGEGRLALYNHGLWEKIGGTNIAPRSVAEDINGQVLIGGAEGQLYTVANGNVASLPPPGGLKPSGVFCITDLKDGQIWLANRAFIGRRTATGWQRLGPHGSTPRSLLAAPAKTGGIWVYVPGELRRYQTDGTSTAFFAPDLDRPREMTEDRDGVIWIATISRGLIRFRPGGEISTIDTTNGLSHSAIRCILQDKEGNFWAGGSLNGLNRFKPRQFITIGRSDGLPDNIVRTITETALGQIIVGTHGGGIAHIHDGKVEPASPIPLDSFGQYVWSVIQDRTGRLWIGTFNDGLLVQDQGFRRPFHLPEVFGSSIAALKEDTSGRIWAGGPGGLGIIEGNAMTVCFTNSLIAGFAITSLAEDTNAGVMWVGTYSHGVFQIDMKNFAHVTPLAKLPGARISSLTMDNDGYLWIGVFEHGLACVHDGKTTLIGPAQGLPAETVGSLLDDGLGYFWLGTTHGILRVARAELQRMANRPSPPAVFNLFNVSDGLGSEYCVEGYQPNALRDHAGHLWFGTDGGVVTVDPSHLRLNTNPPPVVMESIGFMDRSDIHVTLNPRGRQPVIPAGGRELEFNFAALSFTAPEKVVFKYQLEGSDKNWISLGNERQLHIRELAPGRYGLHLAAANNDGVWNETGTTQIFVVQPFVWQTLWFRTLALLAVAGGGGFTVWRIMRQRYQSRIEQLQQQRRLEQERVRLATVMENTSDLVVFADCQGRVIHINPAGRNLIGLAAGDNVRELTLAGLQPGWAVDKVATEGIPAARQRGTWESEAALLHRDGHEIPVSLVLIVHKDAEGQDSFISAIARDITGRKQTEAALKRREKYFRWLTEHASDSITVINAQAIVAYQSSSGERLLGFPAKTILGRSLLELIHPEDLPNAKAGLQQVLAQLNAPVTLTARLRHRDGSWRTIETVGTSSQGETGEKQIVLNSRDLTDHLRLEAQLRQAQKMEAIGQLAGGVAHDFNNILTSLRLQAELMGMTPQLQDGIREGLQQICADTHRAADLTRQLLMFSRRQVMQSRVLDLNQVVLNVTKMLQRIIREDVRLQLNLHPTPLMTFADAGMLDQVLINLAVNARDAMPRGGWLRIETSEMTVGADDVRLNPDAAPGRYVSLSVRDCGGGIPPEIVPRIFEPFFTTKEAGKGTGLGLATVFGIVKQHQGWIKLDNQLGEGMTFHVYLPATTAVTTALPEAKPKPKPRGGRETILLVEDEWAVRMSTRLILERHGYKVLEASDGTEALKLWQEHRKKIALLLSDLVMPGELGGRELGRRLEEEQPGLKVIYASGYSADIAGKDFQLQPGEAFVQKPFVMDQLLEAVRQSLDG